MDGASPPAAPAGTAAGAPAAKGGAPAAALGLLRACRPRQWLKNLLVLAAPAAAGVLTDGAALAAALFAAALFCVAASGTYLLNDAADVRADRAHERKRHRPVASGAVPVRLAVAAGGVLVAAALAAALAAGPLGGDGALALALGGYLLLTGLYTLWLKHVAVCDLVAVAGCHVVRAVAGAAVVGVPVTNWFLLVVSLAALLFVLGKREAELRNPGSGGLRAVLRQYTRDYLARMRAVATGAMIVTYCLWALDAYSGPARALFAASIVPFIMVVLRYNLVVDQGGGEEPEEILLRDRPIQIFLLLLAGLLAAGVYAV
ncbi:decaprenyl-phosphate phosphoribosyltransferase [Allonocardiopsis opalescens]|uniref:Decaprenyl-phosphate phosphoribosyltransferase n=1 Tax=Allonocardiopsis opalescens TaxID=1144618 RepID=A0A2T0QCF9_9ACTN|nr:decaprenyl-phosphate phosphoribosyltransferase [Allonocardiopsis opalescens]PRY01595.1 decaprenyl-phosphate phosphoribosyltransferase [Allonocardiopsis opalescens]